MHHTNHSYDAPMSNHADEHSHDHDAPHDHPHPHDHGHSHGAGLWGRIAALFHVHGHSQQRQDLAADAALADAAEGIRTVWLALAALALTSILQLVIVLWSGSVALFADTIHNVGDALNSIPLLIALYLGRRAATRRYTYGFGRAEDIAGIFIVLSIAISAGVVFWESFQKLLDPQPIERAGWVAAAAIIGFLGNETVAWLQIRTGRRIGSAALVADGMHARTDGLTSLAVLIAVGGSLLGFPIVDPLVGLAIGVAILFITRDAAVAVWYRLMDAVEPETVDAIEQAAARIPGVVAVRSVRVRWMGHRLQAELRIAVDEDLPMRESALVADQVRHTLFHERPRLSHVVVQLDPCGHGVHAHTLAAHHMA